MRKMTSNTIAANVAPAADSLTSYDREDLVTYLRVLDAEAEGFDWMEGAAVILDIDPFREPARAWLAWESHLRRAHWVTERGYEVLVTSREMH